MVAKLTKLQKEQVKDMLTRSPDASTDDVMRELALPDDLRKTVGQTIGGYRLQAKARAEAQREVDLGQPEVVEQLRGDLARFEARLTGLENNLKTTLETLAGKVEPRMPSSTSALGGMGAAGVVKVEAPAHPRTPQNLGPGATALEAFRLFESGHTAVDVMTELGVDYDKALDLLKKFNELKVEEARLLAREEHYIPSWFNIAQNIGVEFRDGCDRYSDSSGTCQLYEAKDYDPAFRKTYPGLFKTVGKKLRLMVMDHPEICALCHRGE